MPGILIVEDESIVAQDLRETLKRLGYAAAEIAASGEEAIQKARALQPALIVMDIRLGDKVDGIEAASQIHQHLEVPIVYLSAYTDEATLQRAKLTHPYGYLVKPFKEKELRATLEMALYKSDMEQRAKELQAKLQQQAEVLEQQNAQLRRLSVAFEQSPAPVIITDAEGRIEYVNERFTQLTGYAPAEVMGQNPRLLKSGRHPPTFYRELWQTIKGGKRWQGEFYNRKKNGEFYWEQATIAPIRDAQGQITHFMAIKEDITARKQVEEISRLNLALQRVRNEILQMKSEQDWEKVVLAFCREVKGMVKFEDCSLNLVDPRRQRVELFIVDPQQRVERKVAAIPPAIAKALESGQPVYRTDRADPLFGEEMPSSIQSVIDLPFAGGTLSVNSTEKDAFGEPEIQLLKEFAQVMSEAHCRLEDLKRVALQEERLRQNQRLELVEQLAVGLAHELNNPLTLVLGYAELLLKKDLEPALRHSVEAIHQGGLRAASIVKRLIAFSRQQQSSKQPVELNALVRESLALVRYAFAAEHVTLVEELEEGLPLVMAHPSQLQQVLFSLLQNSRDALQSAAQEGIVWVRTRRTEGGIRLEVEDNGPGIPAEIQERIFDPFFTTKEVGQGTGLGLSMCRGIIAEHGGRIWVEPREKGACLAIELPAAVGEEASPAPLPSRFDYHL